MDIRLFLSTFVLVFLAELGDKTQLTALALGAGKGSAWSVFLGASVALVVSTLIAVLLGGLLSKIAPPFAVKGAAGALFLVFGALLLVSAVRESRAAPPKAARAVPPASGWLGQVAFRSALAFEESLADRYAELAQGASDEGLRRLWAWLAEEERRHVTRVRALGASAAHGPRVEEDLPKLPTPPKGDPKTREALQRAIDDERRTADFYEALAETTHLGSVRAALLELARDEREHASRMEEARQGVAEAPQVAGSADRS